MRRKWIRTLWIVALCAVVGLPGYLGLCIARHYYRLHQGFRVVETARAEVEQAGGYIGRGNVNGDFFIGLEDTGFEDTQFTRLCEQLHRFPPPHLDQEHRIEIYAANTKITDNSIKQLEGLPVMMIELRGTSITDASIPIICSLPLWRLDLRDTQITDQSVEALSRLQWLQFLDLQDTEITEAGFKELSESLPHYTEIAYTSRQPEPDNAPNQGLHTDGQGRR